MAFAAIFLASCGIEAAGPAEAKSPAEQMAERFAETSSAPAPTHQMEAATQKSDTAAKAADDAQQFAAKKRAAEVAAKRAEEKARKAAATAAAAKSAEQLKADETEMLANARLEAESRRVEMETARIEREMAEVAAIAAEKAKADASAESHRLALEQRATQIAAAAAASKAAEAQKKADELRLAEERRLAEEKLIADAKAAESARIKMAEEAIAKAAEQARAAEQMRVAEVKALEARREAEARALSESLRRADAIREARAAALKQDETSSIMLSPPAPASPAVMPVLSKPEPEVRMAMPQHGRAPARATILIVMEAGNKGIRRFEKTADPVLCVNDGCYVSEGALKPAVMRERNKVLGFANTLGARAGACQRSLGCTFRGVDLASTGGFIQPVDMKMVAHDRRESQVLDADSDCRLDGARLSCRRPVTTATYRLWVVPEALADKAGAAALEAAVREGLPSGHSAGLAQ